LKTNEQLLNEITAAMADTWLAACDRRVIVASMRNKNVVVDLQGNVSLFGPASPEECRIFIHREAALDVLRMLGTERVAGAAMVAGGNLAVTLEPFVPGHDETASEYAARREQGLAWPRTRL
jgi:hypothetical protein